ncbi:uncharacterized protein [Euwallacea fornicatus]|uniref:uncharacterized protein isoform X1 n=1 Tax=Euwallacea fornicatus TaxID=995702 RepID=UPI00338F8F18
MENTNDEKISISGNVWAKENLKSERIGNFSEDKFETITKIPHEEKPLLPCAEINTTEKKDTVKEPASNTRLETEPSDDALKIVKVIKEPKIVVRENSEEEIEKKYVKKMSDSLPCCPITSKEKIIRNQSDILSLKEVPTTLQTSIYSINGFPSRKVYRKPEPASYVFRRNENPFADEKRPSNSYRNPLTGTGLSSKDEYKSKEIKRKEGNPLLGLGYDNDTKVKSRHRIPPGGYSHKLW